MQLWPPMLVEPSTLTTWVNDDATVQALPSVARGLQLYCGLLGQLDLDQVKDEAATSPRPTMLQQPDPSLSKFNFVSASVRDWWVHGNTLALIVARDFRGFPAALKYFPAHAWSAPSHEPEVYYLHGRPVSASDVVHVQRGVDPTNPRRGLGVVEQHLRTLQRAGMQETYENDSLKNAGVPSVAVIAPQKDLTQEDADAAAETWEAKFSGPGRRPAILPSGTEVKTLSWNPNDQQMVMARQLTLTDVANLMNLDPYWLGAPGSSHTYRAPSGMFVALLRVSLEPVMAPFEDVWSRHLVPYGSRVRFYRPALTRDDIGTMATWGRAAVADGLMTVNEWRVLAGLPRLDDPAADKLRPASASQLAGPTPAPIDDTTTPTEEI